MYYSHFCSFPYQTADFSCPPDSLMWIKDQVSSKHATEWMLYFLEDFSTK